MITPLPTLDQRRAMDLYRELKAIAASVFPEWRLEENEGDFGDAFLQIAARLGEHVTRRIDQTPLRDASAFFRMLDVPADWSRPAIAPLVFLLAEKNASGAFAPPGIQVAAATDSGEVIFETTAAIKLTPARLNFLTAADSVTDTIEISPPKFLDLEPLTDASLRYQAVSFAGVDSTVLQLEPIAGLNDGDLIRIDGTVYRIETIEDDLVTLLDPLEINIIPGETTVEKISRFDISTMRDLQEHILYIGHKELLNLANPTNIKLTFNPPSVAAALVSSAYSWSLFGINADSQSGGDNDSDNNEPGWHSVLASVEGDELLLLKDWKGTVEETPINGEKSRWLRVVKNNDAPGAVANINNLRTQSIVMRLDQPRIERLPGQESASSGETITQALHNANPLSLTSAFFPFGSEPQRFDTFALAAPEALSKPGAIAKFQITLSDFSVGNMTLLQTLQATDTLQVYAVGVNGELMDLSLGEGAPDWIRLGKPSVGNFSGSIPGGDKIDVDGIDFSLATSTTVQALELELKGNGKFKLAVVRDRNGFHWAYIDRPGEGGSDANSKVHWFFIGAVPGNTAARDIVLQRLPDIDTAARLLAIGDNRLYESLLQLNGGTIEVCQWRQVIVDGTSTPNIESNNRLVPIQNINWPVSLSGSFEDIVLLDKSAHFWVGELFESNASSSRSRRVHIKWHAIARNAGGEATSEIRPSAAYISDQRAILFAGGKPAMDNNLKPLIIDIAVEQQSNGSRTFAHKNDIAPGGTLLLSPGSGVQCFPRGINVNANVASPQVVGPMAVVRGRRDGGSALALWTSKGEYEVLPVPSQRDIWTLPGVFLALKKSQPTLVLNGAQESINQYRLPNAVHFSLFYWLESDVQISASGDDFIEPIPEADETKHQTLFKFLITDDPVIKGNGRFIYPLLDIVEVALNTTVPWKSWAVFKSFDGTGVPDSAKQLMLDTSDTLTNLDRYKHLRIEDKRFVVTEMGVLLKTDQDVSILPETDFDYEVLLQGERRTETSLTLDDRDKNSAKDKELFIGFVGYRISKESKRVVELVPLIDKLSEGEIVYRIVEDGKPGGKNFTGIHNADNTTELDENDNVTKSGTLLQINNGQFRVDFLVDKTATLVVEPLSLPNNGEVDYHLSFQGKRRREKEIVLNNDDQTSAIGIFLKLRNITLEIQRRFAILHRELSNHSGDIPYDILEPANPAELAVKAQRLYQLDWSKIPINSPIGQFNQLRYKSLEKAAPAFIQSIEISQLSDDSNWVLVTTSEKSIAQDFFDAHNDTDKPKIQIELITDGLNLWQTNNFPRNFTNPELSWEYFDGKGWQRLEDQFVDRTEFFAKSGAVEFKVPKDLQPTEIAGKEDYWIRTRLVGGDFGKPIFKVIATKERDGTITQEVIVDTTALNPPEIISIEASFALLDKTPPEHVLVKNNLAFRTQTQANLEPSAEFDLFEFVAEINRGASSRLLYFGFSKPLATSTLSLFIDAEDQDLEINGETIEFDLLFEVLANDDRWLPLSAADETNGFNRRGYVQVSVSAEPRKTRLFGKELYWLRAGPRKLDGSDACAINPSEHWAPRLNGVFINAARARQAKTVRQEILGSSDGSPGLVLFTSQTPVLPDSFELRVREVLSEEERDQLNAVAQPADAPAPVTQYPELSLAGDWVRWRQVDSFLGQGPLARVFRLDSETGATTFGDDRQGRIPPAGKDNIRAIVYQTGGGLAGNLPAFTITSIKSALEAVDKVANPVAAVGGTQIPQLQVQLRGAPARLRHSQQALTPPDIEALVVASSPDLVRARCLYPTTAGEPIRVVVAMRTGERCPNASIATRKALAALIRGRAWGGLADRDIEIINPDYVQVAVSVRLLSRSVDAAAALEESARKRLLRFLNAVDGGPKGEGWPFGRTIYPSDIFRELASLPDLDRVAKLEKLAAIDGRDLNKISPLSLICAPQNAIAISVDLAVEESVL